MKVSALAFVAFSAAIFCAAQAPAFALPSAPPLPAGATAATLKATPAPYNGPCPVTVKFNGTVSGKPGGKATYDFRRVIGGVTTTSAFATGTLDGFGNLNVSDSAIVDAAHAGSETNTLLVDGGAVKASVSFTVVCTAPAAIKHITIAPTPTPAPHPTLIPINPSMILKVAPTPTPRGTRAPFNPNAIPAAGLPSILPPIYAPSGLTSTTDPGVCSDHFPVPIFGPLICGAAIQGKELVLVWNWSPRTDCSNCPKNVDGYKLYRVDGGKHALLTTVAHGTGGRAQGIAAPAGGYNGICFAVSAYAGSTESGDSSRFCVESATQIGTVTVVLQPAHMDSYWVRDWVDTGITCHDHSQQQNYGSPGVLSIGYGYFAVKPWPCTDNYSTYGRGGIYFDLSSLAGKKVWKAMLHLGPTATQTQPQQSDGDTPFFLNAPHNDSCITQIGTGVGPWWNGGWIDMKTFDYRNFYSPLDYDVTVEVGDWLQGLAPNYGFVFRGEQEGDKQIDYQFACTSNFAVTGQTLTVEYFP